jgi:hypothetical protein
VYGTCQGGLGASLTARVADVQMEIGVGEFDGTFWSVWM